jgi:hypothetical protein
MLADLRRASDHTGTDAPRRSLARSPLFSEVRILRELERTISEVHILKDL